MFIASPEAEKHGLRRYDGQKLLNTEGAELGTIKDLIVHPQTSRVRYVVVSSGGVLGGIWGGWLHVSFLWIDESVRGQHWGTRLMDHAEAYAREHGFVEKSPMPSYKDKLNTQELADLVSYLVSLKVKATP